MEPLNDLNALLKNELQDLYSVEEQILEALPEMVKKASNSALKQGLQKHLQATINHKKRLDEAQQLLHVPDNEKGTGKQDGILGLFGAGQVCKGMEGIISEGQKMINEKMDGKLIDAVIIACAQKVEHYEICGYGTARAYARELKLEKVAGLLDQTLQEEYEANDLLTELATGGLNQQAIGGPRKSSTVATLSKGTKKENAASQKTVATAKASSGTTGNKSAGSKTAAAKKAVSRSKTPSVKKAPAKTVPAKRISSTKRKAKK